MPEPQIKNLLLTFVKNPQKGKVKTRLAETMGEEQALNIYHQLLSYTKLVTDEIACDRQVWYSNFVDTNDIWPDQKYKKYLQKGPDLGTRMNNAFCEAFSSDYDKVVIIGSDCADLNPDIIIRAFKMLDNSDTVIGPSEDGGYYLLGMSAFYNSIFDIEAWSTASVCEQTIKQIEKKNLEYELLPTLNDIDTEEDLIQSNQSFSFA